MVATFGLILVILRPGSQPAKRGPPCRLGGANQAAYCVSGSTNFANPAVSVTRMFSNASRDRALFRPDVAFTRILGGLAGVPATTKPEETPTIAINQAVVAGGASPVR